MKLRNKKTGLVGELYYEPDKEYHFTVATEDPADMEIYRSLTKLNENWDDYKPAEPLIDFYDDRKLVRHWAEVHNIKEVWAHGIGDGKEVVEIYDVRDGLMRMTFYRPKKMGIDKSYTIAELCGKEEE